MYDKRIIEEYFKSGKFAKEILDTMFHGTPGEEELICYDFMNIAQKEGKTYQEAMKLLEQDANDDVEYYFHVGEYEERWGLSQPWCEWEKDIVFTNHVEAQKAYEKYCKEMTNEREFIHPIQIRRKSEEEAKKLLRDLRYKIYDMKEDIENRYPKFIMQYQAKLEEKKEKLPEMEEKLEKAEKEFEAKFGYKLSRW